MKTIIVKGLAVSFFILASLWLGGCRTYTNAMNKIYGAVTIEKEYTLTPSIPYDEAFEDIILAGKDIGFELTYEFKNKGYINMSMNEPDQVIFHAPEREEVLSFRTVLLTVHVKRDGAMATGVKIGFWEKPKSGNIEGRVILYLDALRKVWGAGKETSYQN